MNVKIISDSTCDLSPELIEKYGIAIVPLSVTLGNATGLDGLDVRPEDIYAYVRESNALPKTSAVNVDEYRRVFEFWSKSGYAIVHFCISSEFSSSYQNAYAASEGMKDVHVIDSRNLSSGQGLLVLHGAEMAQSGKTAEEIFRECSALVSQVEASFVVDSLDYLYKGGRCSALSAFGANLLNIKPCIDVLDGQMIPSTKYRGRIGSVMLKYVQKRLAGRDDIDKHRIFITHTQCDPADVQAVRKKIEELAPDFEEILDTTAGATITTHCGPNTLGILFLRKKQG